MFLDEIEKNEVEYVKFCKDKVKDYFIKFFGEKYKNQIERRFIDTPIIFVDKIHQKTETNQITTRIDDEINYLYRNWFFKSFENIDINSSVVDDDNFAIFEQSLWEEDEEIIQKVFKKISRTNHILSKKEIENCKNIFEKEYEDDINKLTILQFKLIDEAEKDVDKILTFEDLKKNKYIANNFNELTEFKKHSLFRVYLNFISDISSTNGSFVCHSDINVKNTNDIKNREKFKYIIYKDIRTIYQQTFIHELLHAVSTCENVKKTEHCVKTTYKCGLKVGEDVFTNQNPTKRERIANENTFLNEVLTDYFAYDITKQMIDNNDKLFLSKMLGSSYSSCFVLVQPLFDKYKEEFKECYISRDYTKIYKFLGENNLKELNHLLDDFSSYAQTYIDKQITETKTFEQGLKDSFLPESPFIYPVINKYNRCFKRMNELMQNIEKYQINKNLDEEITCNK